jgi:hypothetical protein
MCYIRKHGAFNLQRPLQPRRQEQRMRDSGSCSSRDHEALSATSYPAGYAVAAAVEMQHLKHSGDHFSFAPFRKSFEEVTN